MKKSELVNIMKDKEYSQIIGNADIKRWIYENTQRINIRVYNRKQQPNFIKYATELIEAVLHFKYEPRFEG